MKRVVITAVIAFLIAIVIGVLMGLIRDSLKVGLILGRALLSAIGTVGVILVAQMMIKKIFPELLESVEEQKLPSEENDELSMNEKVDRPTFDKERGSKIDVVLNDPIHTDRFMNVDMTSMVKDESEQDKADSSTMKPLSAESFYHEDPRDLAAAVRTTLSRDEV